MLKVPAGVGGEYTSVLAEGGEKKAGRMGGRRGVVLVRDVGAHRDADDVTATCPLRGCLYATCRH